MRIHPTLAAIAVLAACAGSAAAQERSIILQSTTSTAASGLYDHILPAFARDSGIEVHVVAVGTGQALKNARNGDGDVLLVHSRAAEERFVAEGWGVARFDVMYNDFVIVGPPGDPAGIRGMQDPAAALARIAAAGAPFASRGDDSGTHRKELALWRRAGAGVAEASGTWYRETGSGMGATLNAAVGMGAYTLADRGTWIAFANKGEHRILVQGAPELFNPYGAILVNPARHPNVNSEDGRAFIDWLVGARGQRAIAEYEREGQPLFFPNADPTPAR